MKKYPYSEIFYSIQGEGKHTGVPTLWLRYFLCNLQCNGFGQDNPADPTTYELPYKTIDLSSIKKIEDLPVFSKGCDSSYSWSAKFKHLQKHGTPLEIYQEMMSHIPKDIKHPPRHICFTGGEPLMKNAQECTIDILDLLLQNEYPVSHVTFETNGTQSLTKEFKDSVLNCREHFTFFVFSVSPKLYTVSGEKNAVDIDIINSYYELGSDLYIKFVSNGTQESWEEIEHWENEFEKKGINCPIWIMPVGATIEGQKEGKFTDGEIATQALKRGYHVSPRVHVYLWGNVIGV